MVFFTCGACNESLKKNQVEKHYLHKCRRCEFLSCVDCGKDFWGDTYQTHTKCITEEEKYSGKNFVAKANKGEVKQEQWIQKVQSAIQKAPANPQLQQLLQRLEEYPNVPRKKAKFENFLKCSLRIFNVGLQNQVWDMLMAEAHQQQNGNNTTENSEGSTEPGSKSSQTGATQQGGPSTETLAADQEEEGKKKLSKKERKEERRKKTHKAEKKDKQKDDEGVTEVNGENSKKKGKRRKRDEEEEEENGEEEVSRPTKKKKKEENGVEEDGSLANDSGMDTLDDSIAAEEKTGKFNWGLTITAVLESKGEMSVKKLRKKVLAEYASYGGSRGEEKVMATFNKKLSKLPNVKVLKDKVKLIQS
ncbi:cell growth-regulating nucleolar protein-like [Littorina saxatilis]|uniref:Cell growth-regulating nucleolar protein n=1 Tax=Littorina saxatilis TaxID=31220 RepID=A0AAN9GIC0_9CAEN